jgi:hypothetical protein
VSLLTRTAHTHTHMQTEKITNILTTLFNDYARPSLRILHICSATISIKKEMPSG